MIDEALERWGMDFHVLLAIEEMLELCHFLLKFKRKLGGSEEDKFAAVANEMADVELTLLAIRRGLAIQPLVQAAIDMKRKRLRARLNEDSDGRI